MRNLKNTHFSLNTEVKLKFRSRSSYMQKKKKEDWLAVIDFKCICSVFNDREVYNHIIASGMFLRVPELVF